MSSRLIAIRHGETVSNQRDLVSGGNDDPALTQKGIAQALAKGIDLQGSVSKVFSSPKERCITSGEFAFGVVIPASQLNKDLNERHYGRFDGGPNADWKAFLQRRQPEMAGLSEIEQRNYYFGPGIENEAQLIRRGIGVFARLGEQHDHQEIGISTSGGILRAVLLGLGYALDTGKVDNLAQLDVDVTDGQITYVSSDGIHFD